MHEQLVATPVGNARLDWYPAAQALRAVVVLGHGTATGVEARDLQALAGALPPLGHTVVLVTQPYRVEGNYEVAGEESLDRAWTAVWPAFNALDVPKISGGRSAGSQVACRTARALGADAVLALAYPLLGPGSPDELLRTGKPTLVVQGERDPFGRPDQFPKLPPDIELVAIPSANHMLVPETRDAESGSLERVTAAVVEWLSRVTASMRPAPPTDTPFDQG
jgi:predicted alpha/beta-hydrolase family hydrolase